MTQASLLPSLCALALATPTFAEPVLAQPQGTRSETVWYDAVHPDGSLSGGLVRIDVPDIAAETIVRIPAPVSSLHQGLGPVADPRNRVDLVFVGDGYTASQLGAYASRVQSITDVFFRKEPFKTYQNYFTVHRVDVVSNQSGVDHDPAFGVQKDTALGMGYFCGGIERLLCVDVGSALAFASNAPGRDLILAVANATKYGGAGYTSNGLATAASNNTFAIEIALHEFGHSLGGLADEYFTPGTSWGGGFEPGEPNVSTFTSQAMASAMTKWFQWLGAPAPGDGVIGTFRGGRYVENGIYRPTSNSLMRSLGRQFNPPSMEALVLAIYDFVDPIDASSNTQTTYVGSETLSVTPLATVGHQLHVQWFLDDTPIDGANGTTLDLSALALSGCNRIVSVRVTDNTPWVRDAARRARDLTQTLDFQLSPGSAITNLCDAGGQVQLQAVGTTQLSANELWLIASGLVPGTSGVLFLGSETSPTPFGTGVLCAGGPLRRLGASVASSSGRITRRLPLNRLLGRGWIAPHEGTVFHLAHGSSGTGFELTGGVLARFCP